MWRLDLSGRIFVRHIRASQKLGFSPFAVYRGSSRRKVPLLWDCFAGATILCGEKESLDEYIKLPYKLEIVLDTDESGFVASYPELSGCFACGETVAEAVENA